MVEGVADGSFGLAGGEAGLGGANNAASNKINGTAIAHLKATGQRVRYQMR